MVAPASVVEVSDFKTAVALDREAQRVCQTTCGAIASAHVLDFPHVNRLLMDPPTFRRATEDDLSAIVQLLADDPLGRGREVLSTNVDECYAVAFHAIDADPNQLLVVADQGSTTIGCLQLSFIPGLSRSGMWRGQIEGVRVAASHRARGIGRELLQWAIERCRERGCQLVQLTTDKSRVGAVGFYESLGFRANHEGLKLDIARRSS